MGGAIYTKTNVCTLRLSNYQKWRPGMLVILSDADHKLVNDMGFERTY
jgi:hypothetical protein